MGTWTQGGDQAPLYWCLPHPTDPHPGVSLLAHSWVLSSQTALDPSLLCLGYLPFEFFSLWLCIASVRHNAAPADVWQRHPVEINREESIYYLSIISIYNFYVCSCIFIIYLIFYIGYNSDTLILNFLKHTEIVWAFLWDLTAEMTFPDLGMLLSCNLGPHAWQVGCHGNPLGDPLTYLSGPPSLQGSSDSRLLPFPVCRIPKPGHQNLSSTCSYRLTLKYTLRNIS